MELLDYTLPTPEENLACDEALLDEAERRGQPLELLRFWESPRPFVVLGYSSKIDEETHRDACRRAGIPILRRTSGGAAVMAGPGCLMYALVLSYTLRPQLQDLGEAHRTVMGRLCSALEPLASGIEHRGTCDLALDGRKVSGNSLRCRRWHLLYHGTLLYRFPLEMLDEYLGTPPRQPDYRHGRKHREFVANLSVEPAALKAAIADAWQADVPRQPPSADELATLVAAKYGQADWNERR